MPSEKKKNWLYWLGNAAVGIFGLAVTYSDAILPKVFPEHTLVNQLALPIGAGIKFLWDSWKYQRGTIAPQGKVMLDSIPDRITGKFNSLPSGLSTREKGGKND